MSNTQNKIDDIKKSIDGLSDVYTQELKQLEYENAHLRVQLKRLEDFAQEKLDEKDAEIKHCKEWISELLADAMPKIDGRIEKDYRAFETQEKAGKP